MATNVADIVREHVSDTLSQAEKLLNQAAEALSEDKAQELRAEANKKLQTANETLRQFYEDTAKRGQAVCDQVNKSVHDNPWRAIGFAVVAGVVVGLLFKK
ncbi:MAG: hypothetical protein LUC43_03645 [Burkholderiales bacterium]|nr:hypothetical protein [Burkholderiales bacterium]